MECNYCFFLKLSCESIIPANTKIQPQIEAKDSLSPSSNTQPIAQNTDSDENIIAAAVGSEFFWPTICNVYATPDDIIPAYKILIVEA